jgi:hypothetical protein
MLGRRGKEERHVGDVLLRDGGVQRHALQHLGFHFLGRYAQALRLGVDHPVDAVALDDAGLNAVHPHLVRSGFGGEALGEPHHGPLGRGVRGAHREAEASGDRRQVDDAAAARFLDERHGLARAVEHSVEIDRDRAVPVLRADVLDLGGRAGDAGVVHEHVEAVQVLLHILEQALDVFELRHVGYRLRDRGKLFFCAGKGFFINVADMHPRAMLDECAGDHTADAGGAGGDQDAQTFGRELHAAA